jgi:hypothetical protein
MNSISEGEFQKLSPQDQEKAMAEIMESCRQTRSQLKETITQAQACAAGDDPRRAEAYLIPALEHGRPRQIAVGAGATAADRCRGQGDPQHGSTGRTVIRPNDLYPVRILTLDLAVFPDADCCTGQTPARRTKKSVLQK